MLKSIFAFAICASMLCASSAFAAPAKPANPVNPPAPIVDAIPANAQVCSVAILTDGPYYSCDGSASVFLAPVGVQSDFAQMITGQLLKFTRTGMKLLNCVWVPNQGVGGYLCTLLRP